MWIIILKIILAIISIFTGGAIFYKYIKDNKLAVFLAGSVSILSAVYLFIEVKKDIKKLNVPTMESQSSLESEASAPNNKRNQSLPIPSSKWITPSDSDCESNGGEVKSDGCYATWKEASKICKVSGGSLPSIDELREVVTDCGGEIMSDVFIGFKYNQNEENSAYQACYKRKGFSSNLYWSSSIGDYDKFLQYIYMGGGIIAQTDKLSGNYVRCVRARQ